MRIDKVAESLSQGNGRFTHKGEGVTVTLSAYGNGSIDHASHVVSGWTGFQSYGGVGSIPVSDLAAVGLPRDGWEPA